MTADVAWGENLWPSAEIDRRARRVAGGFAALGLDDGDVVAVMMRNDVVWIDIVQACRVAGTYYCPINWHFKAEETGFILRDSGAKVLMIHADLLPAIADAIPAALRVLVVGLSFANDGRFAGCQSYDVWLAAQHPYAGPERQPRGHMAYTSGTSGRPKGVRRLAVPQERQAVQQRLAGDIIRLGFGLTPGVRALVSAPLYHSAPSLFCQQAMAMGSRFVLAARFDAEETLALIEQHAVETVYLVPIMYVRLLRLRAEVRARYDLSSLRFVASTGAPCAPDVKRAMIDWLGPVINETYASSETGLVTAIDAPTAARKVGSVGRPLGEATIAIVDVNGNLCPPGVVGTIYVRQPSYADFTYNNNDAARRDIDRNGLVTVGDMGHLDEDGFLYVSDRISDMVISGGVNIYPAEIEHVLIDMPGIADCAVFGIPDAEYGEALVAAIVLEQDSGLALPAIQAHLVARIAKYKVPRRMEIVTSLPRDDNGKVAKRKLRDAYAPKFETRPKHDTNDNK